MQPKSGFHAQKPPKWPSSIFRNLPNKCGAGKRRARVKGPRWTEQRLQYMLFRGHYITPPVTSRGIPELLNHCGPSARAGAGARGGAGAQGRGPPRPRPHRTLGRPPQSGDRARATACRARRRGTRLLAFVVRVSQLGDSPRGCRRDRGGGTDTGSPARRACRP